MYEEVAAAVTLLKLCMDAYFLHLHCLVTYRCVASCVVKIMDLICSSANVCVSGVQQGKKVTVVIIWKLIGQAVVDLFASLETMHCHFWYTQNSAPLTMDAFAPFQLFL